MMLLLLTLTSAVSGFLFGYDTAVVSSAMLLVRHEFELSDAWHELLVSSPILVAFLSSPFSGLLADTLGRRLSVLFSAANFGVGSVVCFLANNKVVLLLGRLVLGLGLGVGSTVVPVYISECAPAHSRGRLVTVNNLFITGGQFFAGVFCAVALDVFKADWRLMLGFAALPAFLQLLAVTRVPESPRFLVAQHKMDEARSVLHQLRGRDESVQAELDTMASSESSEGLNCAQLRLIASTPHFRRSLLIGCGLQFFQQACGINTVMYYSASIIEMAGVVQSDEAVLWLTAVTAFVNFACTFIGLYLVEKIGRRPLLLGSLSGVTLSLLLLSLSFRCGDACSSLQRWIPLLGLCLYLLFFAPGMGPLPWTINSEIHASAVRSTCVALATSVNWGTNMIVSLSFLSLIDLLGASGAFALYCVIALIGLVVMAAYLPETKGIGLEVMDKLFSRNEPQYQRVFNEDLYDDEEDESD